MKTIRITIGLLCLSFVMAATAYSQIDYPRCDNLGRINGIYYTDCFPWLADNDPNTPGNQSDDTLTVNGTSGIHNDTLRLQRALTNTYGKLIFNESN